MNGWGRITLIERNEHRKHAVFKKVVAWRLRVARGAVRGI